MLTAAAGESVKVHFSVFEEDGITRLSGLLDGDFTKALYVDNAVSAVVPTVTEIGSTGVYVFDFTPDVEGRWLGETEPDQTDDVFGILVDVGPVGASFGFIINEAQMNVAYDEGATNLYMEVWLDRNGQSVAQADLVSCSVDVYDEAGALLFNETSSSPQANGRFNLERILVLAGDRPFNASVTVTDSVGAVTTFQAFTTVN